MKKLIVASAISFASFGLPVSAVLADTVTNSGPGSYTTVKENNTLKYTCNNSTYVVLVNNQTAGSGSVTVSQNTTSGSATSGNATNSNNTSISTSISCVPASLAVTKPPLPTGGKGGVVAGAKTSQPAVNALPNTGSSLLSPVLIASAALVVSGLGFVSGAFQAVGKRLSAN